MKPTRDQRPRLALFGFTLIEDGDLTLRIGPSADAVVVGAHALAEANRLLALH